MCDGTKPMVKIKTFDKILKWLMGRLYFLDLEFGVPGHFVHFFEDGTKFEIPSEITPPLPLADLINAKISFGYRPHNFAVQILRKRNWVLEEF